MKSPRTKLNVALVAVGVVLTVGALGTLGQMIWQQNHDPGITFCESIKDGQTGTTDEISEQEYLQAREKLRKSNYQDIREHGIAILDIVWQIQSLEEGEELGALVYVPTIQAHMSKLQTACADRGIVFTYNTN